jgi:glucose-1-phosphate adenylyltransferase
MTARIALPRVASRCCPRGGPIEATLPVSAFVLAGGVGSRLGPLTAIRPKPLVPFGGHRRLIDFTLSNCASAGVPEVTLLAQHLAAPLAAYVGDGAPWGFGRRDARMRVLRPPTGAHYAGTADAVRYGLALSDDVAEAVLVLAADHVYAMDYAAFIEAHLRSGADVTVSVTAVAPAEAHRFGIALVADDGAIVEFEEKPAQARGNLASMAVYAFAPTVLRRLLAIDAAEVSTHDLGRDIVPLALELGLDVRAHRFEGYWQDVGTPESYWRTHRDLLLGDADLALRAAVGDACAGAPHGLAFGPHAGARESRILGGCSVEGIVERSVIGPGVTIGPGAIVRDSVLLAGTRIEAGATVDHAILDERSVVGAGASVGRVRRAAPFAAPRVARPITVVASGTRIAPGAVIPGGAVIEHATGVVTSVRAVA